MILVGGFGEVGMPLRLVEALSRQAVRDLTLVSNNAGTGKKGLSLYPLTAPRCVATVFTDLGVFDCGEGAFFARELAPGVSKEHVTRITEGRVEFP